MALGVLNNLSAIYAENNLNNTNNSLQTVLQQLSSGSKINSGADDAAGLSLVNGLEANQTALMQSETNATEGVGLLDVADGALSQVTSLLDRAITLATEASNGTLNSTQEGAANQEYQSILSEINNIGSTTTYNQEQVFAGNTIAIYTGDSSTAGSSIDDLNIRTLSESGVGDTNGAMSYSSGKDNVFIDLSNAGHNAAVTDSLGTSTATTTIDVSYMSKGANGAAAPSTAAISAGAGTSYANTAQGLIEAINNSGLGLNATFATAQQAGTAAVATAEAAADGGGASTDTGIEISAANIGTGSNGVGVVGALSLTLGDTLGGTLSIVGSDGASHNITLGTANSTDTLTNLESTINAAGYGVTASLNLAGTELTFTTADSKVGITGDNLTDISPAVPATTTITGSVLGTMTVGAIGDTLGGSLTITPGVASPTGTPVTPVTLALGTSGAAGVSTDTLAHLAATINANVATWGITATTNPAIVNGNAIGTVLTLTKAGPGTVGLLAGDLGTPSIAGTGITDTVAATVGAGDTLGTMTVNNMNDALSGTLTGVNNAGTAYSIQLGQAGTSTLAQLANTLNTTDAALGITATVGGANSNVLNFSATNGDTGSPTVTAGNFTDAVVTDPTVTITAPVAHGNLASFTVVNSADVLGGTLALTTDTGASSTLTLGTVSGVANQSTDNIADLAAAFNNAGGAYHGLGITASVTNGGKTITLADNGTGPDVAVVATTASPVTDTTLTSTALGAGTLVDTLSARTLTDPLSGTLTIDPANSATPVTINLGTNNTNSTLAELAATLTTGGYGLTASTSAVAAVGTVGQNGYVAAHEVMTVTELAADYGSGDTASVSGVSLGDAVSGSITPGTILGTLTVGNSTDTLTGILDGVEGNALSTAYSISLTGQTLAQLATTINTTDALYGITATPNQAGTSLTFTATTGDIGSPTLGNDGNITATLPADPTAISLTDAPTTGQANSTDLGSLTILSTDTLTGSLGIGSNTIAIGTSDDTAATLATTINKGDYGVTATYDATTNTMSFISANSSMTVNSTLLDEAVGSSLPSAVPAFTPSGITTSGYYSVGIAGTVQDTSTVATVNNVLTYGGTANVGLTADMNGSTGTATTSYSDNAGENLSNTDLNNQTNAEAALTDINLAISDAAALDGYIGGQINTLNSISQVMSTQQENVVSAQNAVQATDYASATSNMSKYEILSQTGIAALAQANSVQQEVTKLLQ
jgi:flagellin